MTTSALHGWAVLIGGGLIFLALLFEANPMLDPLLELSFVLDLDL